uniref:Uncharacterized protein n=1 Tax=viral metagenome TaxID=1070528 RepID=A0A6H2A2Y4_9ZZZZ
MPIPLNDPTYESNGVEIAKGVYASEVIIKDIQDVSNHPNREKTTMGSKGFEPEIALIVNYDTGMGFDKKIYLFGKYIKDTVTGKLKGWSAKGNDVQGFLRTVYGNDAYLEDDYSIPKSLLARCAGKKFTVVRFVDGWYKDKPSYSNWGRTFPAGATAEEVSVEWFKAVNYMKKYNPSIIDEYRDKQEEEATSFKPEEYGEDPI